MILGSTLDVVSVLFVHTEQRPCLERHFHSTTVSFVSHLFLCLSMSHCLHLCNDAFVCMCVFRVVRGFLWFDVILKGLVM